MTSGSRGGPDDSGLPRRWARSLFHLSPWGLRRDVRRLQQSLEGMAEQLGDHLPLTDRRLDRAEERLDRNEHLRAELDDLRARFDGLAARADELAAGITGRFDTAEHAIRLLQNELAELRDDRVLRAERRLDEVERIAGAAEAEAARLRERVLPAVVDRDNLLIDRLAEQLDEVTSLVERMLANEPLPLPLTGDEQPLADDVDDLQPALLEAFRGSEHEISHRLDRYLPLLRGAAPVLDLGCGRGELLSLLRSAGVEARGVESDRTLAEAARRRGLRVERADAVAALRALEPGRLGAVTAIHLLEHLPTATLLELLAAARRALQPGGLLLAECPNPHSLRVGAALYWCDPTHRRPLLPETLRLLLTTSGFEVRELLWLHPFPEEQSLSAMVDGEAAEAAGETADIHRQLAALAARLDELLNGPRDFAVVAAKPAQT